MPSNNKEFKTIDRHVITVDDITIAEKIRNKITWCTGSLLTVYIYFNNSLTEDEKEYHVHVGNEIGGYLDDARYDTVCETTLELLDDVK